MDFGGKNRIFVTGIGDKTGATSVAIFMAKFLADEGEKASYVQLTEGLETYYYLAMDKKEDWNDFYQMPSIRNSCNMIEKVNWAVRMPSDEEVSSERKRMLINQMPGRTLVIDSDEYLDEADMIVCVIDPLPSKILQNIEKIKALKKMEYEGYNVVWIVNKMNKGVSLSQLKKSLKLGEVHTINFIEQEAIYQNEYSGSGILRSGKVGEVFREAFLHIFK